MFGTASLSKCNIQQKGQKIFSLCRLWSAGAQQPISENRTVRTTGKGKKNFSCLYVIIYSKPQEG